MPFKDRETRLRYNREYAKKNSAKAVRRVKEWRRTHKRSELNYCYEWPLIEGYDKMIADGYNELRRGPWVVHHKLEDYGFTVKILKKINMYYNRPANELIIMTKAEHSKHHRELFNHFQEEQ